MLIQIPGSIAHVESSEVVGVNMSNFDCTEFRVFMKNASHVDSSTKVGTLDENKAIANARLFAFVKAVNEANSNE